MLDYRNHEDYDEKRYIIRPKDFKAKEKEFQEID